MARGPENDGYAATAGAYDLLNGPFRAAQVAAIEPFLLHCRPEAGPVLDVGAGSGLNTELVLSRLPGATVLAIEPSPAMRALLLGRVAGHPEWHRRVTVRPESLAEAPLPPVLGGVIMLGVIGHFAADDRRRALTEVGRRLAPGAPLILDLQEPLTPTTIPPATFGEAELGGLRYRGRLEARPDGADWMVWRMTYQTVDGDRIVYEASTEHRYCHPAPAALRAEALAAGLEADRADGTGYWIFHRR